MIRVEPVEPCPYLERGPGIMKPASRAKKHSDPGRQSPVMEAESLEEAARLFKAISEVPRLRLLMLLARGEICVTELADAEGETISTISQRLRVLRNQRIVLRRRR